MGSRWEQVGAGLLNGLANAVIRYPRWFFFPQILLFGFCVWFTIWSPWKLQFDESRDNLVGAFAMKPQSPKSVTMYLGMRQDNGKGDWAGLFDNVVCETAP